MNSFETLLAPPSLTPRDLAIHTRMHPEIPAEVSGACRNELVKVGVRLHDELTTLRFASQLAETPAPKRYSQVNSNLTRAHATPIEWKFFAAEFEAFMATHPERMGAKQMLAAICGLPDPWHIQAWSAQALRIAQNAETEDPKHAHSAWRVAVKLYTAFFAVANVTESYTYRFQTDPAAQAACRASWNSFLADEVATLSQRVTDYGSRQQAAAVSAALAVLSQPEVAAVNPEAARRAKAAAQGAFLSGIKSASTLRAAFDLYYSASKSDELDRALLAAMTAETAKLAKGFGGADEVDWIELSGEALEMRATPDDQVGSLMRSARNEFYESATDYARTAINDDATRSVKALAARVLALLPPDRVAGHGPNGETITVAEVIERLLGDVLRRRLLDAPVASAEEEQALSDIISFAQSHPLAADENEWLKTNLIIVFKNSAGAYLQDQLVNARCLTMVRQIADYLPPKTRVDLGGENATLREYSDKLAKGESGTQFNVLRRRLLDAPVASAEEEEALSDIISFARSHPLAADEKKWLKTNLIIVFKNSAGAYLQDQLVNARCLTMMRQIADYLPPKTRVDLGEKSATIAAVVATMGHSGGGTPGANGMQFNVLRRRLLDAPVASAEEEEALSDIISFARSHTLAADEKKWLRTNLIIVFKNSAGAYLESQFVNARCLTMMRQIADYLPPNTRVDLGGEKATLREHSDKLRAFAAMLARGTSNRPTPGPSGVGKAARTGVAYLLAAVIWGALIFGWFKLAQWVGEMFTGNPIMQTIVIVLAVLLPVLAIWRAPKR